ncbi:MAG TPA: hypothetical protein VH561_08130 [Micromonosporaceae bacterium]|jgi:hypothetical protein
MSQTITESTITNSGTASPFVRSLRWGIGSLIVGVLVAISPYGSPDPQGNQQQAVPFICAVLVVVAIGLFGFFLPAGLRGITTRTGRWSGWALATSIVGLVAIPASFWSGLPILLGTVATVLGSAGRRATTTERGRSTAAFVIGIIVTVGGLVLAILGATVIP